MPNWCDADVTIYGSREALEAVLAKASEGTREVGSDWDSESGKYLKFDTAPNVFSFENFLPTPPKELEEGGDWYSWRIDNWGTKWDLNQHNVQVVELQKCTDPRVSHEYEFGLGFQTAWSPAIPVFLQIAKDFDVFVEYKFIEEGMAFFGIVTMDKDGEISDISREPTTHDYIVAGCAVDAEGEIDWDNTDEYDLYLALDTWEEETEGEENE